MATAFNYWTKRLSLTALIGFFLITPCVAEPLPVEIGGARGSVDERTTKPILKISLTGVSKQAVYYLSINNIAKKIELRIDGKRVLTSVIREPLAAGVVQISSPDLTSERINELVTELSRPGIRVEVDTPSD
jgi:hypothetical protein